MRLSWLDEAPGADPIAEAELERVGVLYRYLSTDPSIFEPALSEVCRQRGYVARDEVCLTPQTPNLEELNKKFIGEHLHTDDEVRFVLEGAGIFDIRSADDRWMRVEVGPGDLLVVPKDLYHRFLLTELSMIRCVRLFQDKAGWVPVYRQSAA